MKHQMNISEVRWDTTAKDIHMHVYIDQQPLSQTD